MDAQKFEKSLQDIVGQTNVMPDEPLAGHTTFRIGGPAQWLVMPHGESEVVAVAAACRAADVPLRVLGAGSNVLAPDEGLSGVTLLMAQNYAGVEVLPGGMVRAQAGATNEAVAAWARDAGLAGYEFASGIPGTIGGAAIMNAGAYEGQFSDVAVEVRCLMPDGALADLPASEAAWGYRTSRMMREGLIVLAATLLLRPDSREAITARMDDLRERREEKQPLEMASAGSTFKRPEGYFAGKLIQEAGLQGTSVGGAQVSTKHAGFVVNTGGATAADVLALIALVQERVMEDAGVQLEPEVRLWQ
ncbi:UDP-N-acetylmuramate dehydrogenase [Adlercreutzia sp. R25]|uniref:UDP-N-acetylenolpyruvoylglucosamine reductase n=1 Tax=Adlercreutzia shanghongiae TaxID=3111773 RepID=A0ABU6IWB3_9ACTN|nr:MULTISPECIES: UDP-N-acetylmuramate dehydrogenase [unclassified Adlercreutzia]MEC4273828.1 UDP-N-acetylmuramate dehydrogenase [Adlercreutzia sp. R25]MEC4294116.1 UDP-N-acetylmuramate dehydrogenase [Adlercreutzia sp. R22]